jgi:drug/metabolite transporter (DMT)-like permease
MITMTANARVAIGSGALATTIVGASVPVSGMLQDYPVLAGQSLRYLLAGLILLAWARTRRIPVPLPGPNDLVALLGLVATGLLGFNACLLYAQRYAQPGFVAALLGGTPLVLALIAPRLTGRRPRAATVAGAAVVVGGIVVLSGGGSWHGPGLFLAVLAALGEASFTLLAVGVIGRLGGVAVSTWCCLLAGAGGAALATCLDGTAAWRTPTAREAFALLTLAVVVTAVGFCCWYRAVSDLGAARAGVLIGLMPVSGFVVSVALGAQPLSLVSAAGVGLVTVGCVLGLRPEGRLLVPRGARSRRRPRRGADRPDAGVRSRGVGRARRPAAQPRLGGRPRPPPAPGRAADGAASPTRGPVSGSRTGD